MDNIQGVFFSKENISNLNKNLLEKLNIKNLSQDIRKDIVETLVEITIDFSVTTAPPEYRFIFNVLQRGNRILNFFSHCIFHLTRRSPRIDGRNTEYIIFEFRDQLVAQKAVAEQSP